MSDSTILDVKELSVTFGTGGREKVILDSVTFSLSKSRILGIVGESVSGKTITAQSILLLVPSPPLKKINGEIWFDKQNLLQCSASQMRTIRGKRIAYIFQEPWKPDKQWAMQTTRVVPKRVWYILYLCTWHSMQPKPHQHRWLLTSLGEPEKAEIRS